MNMLGAGANVENAGDVEDGQQASMKKSRQTLPGGS
jgi:hypothetical protein